MLMFLRVAFNGRILFTFYTIANTLVFYQVFSTFVLILVLFPFSFTTFDNVLSHLTIRQLTGLNLENIKYFISFIYLMKRVFSRKIFKRL